MCLAAALLTGTVAFRLRLLEWPSWQDAEFRLGDELLLATHDAYHWVAGAEGFEFGAGHPMSELLRLIGLWTGYEPAAVAFWLPPIMASLTAVSVFFWGRLMGGTEAGVCAGVLTSLSPGFLARTLLGYGDTDLVTLLLPLLMGLLPAWWVTRFLCRPAALLRIAAGRTVPAVLHPPSATGKADPVGPLSVAILACAGLFAWWSREWHSLFPYLIRYNALLLPAAALLLSRKDERKPAFLAALCMGFPSLMGPPGLLPAVALLLLRPDRALDAQGRERVAARLCLHPILLCGLSLPLLVLLCDAEIVAAFVRHLQSYLKRAGDPAASIAAADPLVYPSVARSIIEIQDLSLPEILIYFHPFPLVAVLGLLGFAVVLWNRAGTLFLLPLVALALLSTRMGGRMVMFGAPVVALGLTLPAAWAVQALCRRLPTLRSPIRRRLAVSTAILIVAAIAVPPLAELIPAMTHGPILNRRHADGLRAARKATAENGMLWLWWDWGYAAHHFSRRPTIADGAAHGGPSLYLPAAVFTTDNARFARQIIKYTALHDNVPGNVFKGMDAPQAAALMRRLADPQTPLIEAPGKQYVEVSFDMLSLGFWITTFGNWDFLQQEGRGYAISIVPRQLAYRLDTGDVVMQGTTTAIPAASIDLFEDGRLVHRNYLRPEPSVPRTPQALRLWKEDAEQRRNVHFLFNRVTGEKLVVDDNMYNTLMTRLLLRPPNDPALLPYFRLIFDNVFCRIYEVL